MNRFIVVTLFKVEKEESKEGQISIRKMSLSLDNETVFNDYFMAKEYASNFKFAHVILKEDFKHWVKRSELLAFTVKAFTEGTKCISNKVVI